MNLVQKWCTEWGLYPRPCAYEPTKLISTILKLNRNKYSKRYHQYPTGCVIILSLRLFTRIIDYIVTFKFLHLLVMVAYATQFPTKYETSLIWDSFPICDNFQAFSLDIFITPLVRLQTPFTPNTAPHKATSTATGNIWQSQCMPSVEPLFFATSLFDPKGPFIFPKTVFWPHLAPTEGSHFHVLRPVCRRICDSFVPKPPSVGQNRCRRISQKKCTVKAA